MVLEGCKQLKPLVPLLKSINSNKSAVEFAFSLQETKHIRLSADCLQLARMFSCIYTHVLLVTSTSTHNYGVQ